MRHSSENYRGPGNQQAVVAAGVKIVSDHTTGVQIRIRRTSFTDGKKTIFYGLVIFRADPTKTNDDSERKGEILSNSGGICRASSPQSSPSLKTLLRQLQIDRPAAVEGVRARARVRTDGLFLLSGRRRRLEHQDGGGCCRGC